MPEAQPSVSPESLRRRFVPAIFLVLVVVLAIDGIPTGVPIALSARDRLSRGLKQMGLGVGPWMMFAPDPTVDNSELVAERLRNGTTTQVWISPQWGAVPAWQRFHRFRWVNYCNRMTAPTMSVASEDFADYLARTVDAEFEPDDRLRLSISGWKLLPPAEGGIPTSDDVTWMLYSEPIATVDASPGRPAGDEDLR